MFVFLSDSVLLRYIRALYFRPSCPHIETRTSYIEWKQKTEDKMCVLARKSTPESIISYVS